MLTTPLKGELTVLGSIRLAGLSGGVPDGSPATIVGS